jgi:nitrite reductase/ring-hydroxylating ferredoxin subunit
MVRLFDRDWLLFRTASGEFGLTARQCPHMGADLALGRVAGECLECPLHGYQFDVDGNCVNAPESTHGSPRAVLRRLSCRERYGMVFAFLGETPTFDIPQPPEMPTELACSSPLVMHFDVSHYVFGLNPFDVRHFDKVHNRRFVSYPDITIDSPNKLSIVYEAEIIRRRWVDYLMSMLSPKSTRVIIDCWGANFLAMTNRDTGYGSVICAAPLGRNRTRLYISGVMPRAAGAGLVRRARDAIALKVAAVMVREYLRPDIRFITGQIPIDGPLIDDEDLGVLRFWEYFNGLPRYRFGQA